MQAFTVDPSQIPSTAALNEQGAREAQSVSRRLRTVDPDFTLVWNDFIGEVTPHGWAGGFWQLVHLDPLSRESGAPPMIVGWIHPVGGVENQYSASVPHHLWGPDHLNRVSMSLVELCMWLIGIVAEQVVEVTSESV